MQRAKKAEVNELKDMLSERESRVLDLEMTAKDLEAQMTSLQGSDFYTWNKALNKKYNFFFIIIIFGNCYTFPNICILLYFLIFNI